VPVRHGRFSRSVRSPDYPAPNPASQSLRLDFPFAPAMWNSVVSVSALPLEDADGNRAWYSNSGEVTFDGRWTHTATGMVLEGTSFAAPRLSHQEALYLLTGGPVQCVTPAHVPPLGYTNIDAGIFTWQNLPLTTAVTSYCQAFTNQARPPGQPSPNPTA